MDELAKSIARLAAAIEDYNKGITDRYQDRIRRVAEAVTDEPEEEDDVWKLAKKGFGPQAIATQTGQPEWKIRRRLTEITSR